MVRTLPRRKGALPAGRQARWQREQNGRKNKKKKRVIGYWLLGIGILLIVGLAFEGLQIFRHSLWDGKTRINFVLAGEETSLVSFGPTEEELVNLAIPAGTQIEVTHGYGKYRIEAVWKLGKQEKRKELLVESLQENFGVPVEGWIYTTESRGQRTDTREELLSDIRKQILGKGETNLSKWDLVRLWWQVKKVRFDRAKSVDLSKISVLISSASPDGTQIWEIDKSSLDAYLARLVSEPKIREENLAVEVLNGTTHSGLAEQGARIISNIGGEVSWVGNSDIKYQKSNIKSRKEQKNSFTVQQIMKIFNAEWEEKEEEGRAEITLILGEDYWQKLNQK